MADALAVVALYLVFWIAALVGVFVLDVIRDR